MRIVNTIVLLAAVLGIVSGQTLTPKIVLPKDSPVGLLTYDFSNSTTSARGGTYIVDVRGSLSLRNETQRRIRSITLAVYAQEVAPGGVGSVTVPSLNVGPSETFSVRIENHLLRPLVPGAGGPSVEVKLDGILFDDLSFYGPDSLNSQRSMTHWELEARRDRDHFKSLLKTAGSEGLRKEMLASLARQNDRGPGVQMVRSRSTNVDSDREIQLAFASMAEAPVEVFAGTARVSTNEASAPHFTVKNRSTRPIEHLDMGWIVKDAQGREFFAASTPADLKLAPNQSGDVRQDSALHFQQPVDIRSITGFLAGIEYADGTQWIPTRAALSLPALRDHVPASPEEQRLLQIYNKKGLDSLIEELKKF
ncbi:MAG: hypothetical protein ABI811_13670 [Acidobacteriota bacterium]